MPLKNKLLPTLVCFIVLHLTWCVVNAKVVVFFPVPGTSHIRYHTNVAREMSNLGHEAWVCIPEHAAQHSNIDTSGINVLRYGQTLGDIEGTLASKTNIHKSYWENRTQSIIDIFNIVSIVRELTISILADGLSDKIQGLKPDLFVIDGLSFIKAIFVVPYKLDIPYAVVGTIHDAIPYRIPFSPASTPTQMSSSNDQMDFGGRLKSALTNFFMLMQSIVMDPDAVSIFAPEKTHKSLLELMALAEVYIVELDPILDYARPMLPNTKLVGGTATKPAKPLKDPFKGFVDGSKKGLIIISFGSSVVHFPNYIFEKFNAACMAAGLNIIWRSDQPSPDPKRILTHEWLPQNDILGHVNTKLFISHCGKNGQYEALYHGVPMLCVPIFGDQPYNAERIRTKGYGLKADMRFISQEDLTELVRELITNTTYKNNIVKASKLFRLLYKSPMKEAAFWLDHVMEYGGDYMRASSQKMPLYQFFMLDILAVVFAVIVLVLFIVYCLIHSCVRFFSKPRQSKSKSE